MTTSALRSTELSFFPASLAEVAADEGPSDLSARGTSAEKKKKGKATLHTEPTVVHPTRQTSHRPCLLEWV